MTSVKPAPFAVFLLAALLMFPMKNVEADCLAGCSQSSGFICGAGCLCYAPSPYGGACAPKSFVDPKKMVEKHANVCQSHAECTKKGSGSFCARYPNSNLEYGWCFASNSEAEDVFFKIASNSKFTKDFLKMTIST